MIYEVVANEKSSRTSTNIFHITKTPHKNQRFISTNDISPEKACLPLKKLMVSLGKRTPKASISKRYSWALRKVAAIIKIIISQDASSLEMILSIILNMNEDLINLIISKRKYFIGLLSQPITKKELQMMD